MANEFVTRTGLIVSGSTYLPSATSASKGYILSFDDSTKQVYYMSTSSVTVTVPGSDTQIIYNNGGAFGAASNFVFSGSNVGIGTASPQNNLHISGAASSDAANIRIDSTTQYGGLVINENTTFRTILGYGNAGNIFQNAQTDSTALRAANYLHLGASSAATLTINSSDNVGIGTTSPNAKLDVSGSVLISGSLTVSGSSTFTNIGPAVFTGSITQNASTASFGGLVGIGTTTPGYRLEVKSGASNSFFTSFTPSAGSGAISIYQDSNNHPSIYGANASGTVNIVLNTNGVSYLQGGNVIVGGSNDDGATFQVKGNITATSFTGSFSGSIAAPGSTTQVLFNSGGSLAAASNFVFSGSNVGIGTATPTQKLEIFGLSDVALRIHKDSVGEAIVGISGSAGASTTQFITNTNGFDFRGDSNTFPGGGSSRLFISSSGNVGIGTSSPTAKLDVRTDTGILIKGATSDTDGRVSIIPASGGRQYDLRNYGSSFGIKDASADVVRMFFHNNGNTGIANGTTTPAAKLDIGGNATGSVQAIFGRGNDDSSFTVRYTNGSAGTNNTVQGTIGLDYANGYWADMAAIKFIRDSTAGALAFYTSAPATSGVERVRIDSNGNVGIGTTSPIYQFDITTANYKSFRIQSSDDALITIGSTVASSQFYSIGASGIGSGQGSNLFWIGRSTNNPSGSLTKDFVINSSGNVGIGTASPSYKLDVNGQSRIAGQLILSGVGTSEVYTADASGLYLTAGTAAGMYLQSDGTFYFRKASNPYTEYMRIAGTGDVQIGTTAYAGVGGSGYLMVKNVIGIVPDNTASTNNRNWAIQANGQFSGSLDFVTSAASASFPNDAYRVSFTRTGGVVASSFTGSFSGSVSAPGSTTQIVYNNGGALAGASAFTYNSSNSNVGIGSTPASNERLRISTPLNDWGVMFVTGSTTTGGIHTNNNVLTLQADNADYINLEGANVGIGTTTPGELLEVVGNIRANVSNGGGFMLTGASASGLVRAGATGLALRTNTTDRLTIDNSGNVGIGITSPSTPLHIAKNSTYNNVSTAAFRIANITSPNKGIDFGYDNTADVGFIQGIEFGVQAKNLTLQSDGGNVGIGTTSPSYKLDVNGTLGVSGNATFNGGNVYINSDNSFIGNNTTDVVSLSGGTVYLPGNGNVGIGTTSPISGQGTPLTLASSTGYVGLTLSGSGAYSHLWQLYASGDGGSSKFFGIYDSTNAVYRLVTTSTGNVGIGTTNPTYNLHVSSSGYYGGNLTVEGTITAQKLNVQQITSSVIYSSGSNIFGNSLANTQSFTGSLQVTGSTHYLLGDVGIGTTNPSGQLSGTKGLSIVDATNAALGLSNGTNHWLNYLSGTTYRIWNNSVSEVMTLTLAGNVGIGTTSPLSPLHQVAGGVDYTGEARFGGSSTAFGVELKYNQAGPTSGSIYVSPAYSSTDVLFKLGAGSGNANQLVLKGDGNVGIGTTSPGGILTVQGSSNQLVIGNSWSTANHDIIFAGGSSNSTGGANNTAARIRSVATAPGGAATGDLLFTVNSGDTFVNALYISGSGNVGIGTTSPDDKLEVEGGGIGINNTSDPYLRFRESGTIVSDIFADTSANNLVVRGSSGHGVEILASGASEGASHLVVSGSSGRVGIGIASPVTNLHINGVCGPGSSGALSLAAPAAGGGCPSYIIMGNSDSAGTAGPNVITSGNRTLAFGVGDSFSSNSGGNFTGSMYIIGSGNVGIGTSSPGTKLEITTADSATTVYPLSLTNPNNQAGDGGGTGIKFSTSSGPGGAGNEALKYSSIEAFDVNNYGSNSGLSFTTSLGYTKTKSMVIDRNGNVGIGTTAPNATLQVANTTSGNAFSMIGSNSKEFVSISYLGYLRSRASDTNGANMHFADNGNTKRMEMAVNTTSMTWYSDALAANFLYFHHSTGNVSIGTSNSSQRLHVSGAIAIEAESTTTKYSTTFSGTLSSNTNIAFIPTGSFKAAFFDYYVASSSTNMRAGTIMAVQNNSTSRYTDTSTGDIGNTSAVDFSTSVVSGNLVLTANIASGTWEIKTAYRAL